LGISGGSKSACTILERSHLLNRRRSVVDLTSPKR
jgi:hypothetical protein